LVAEVSDFIYLRRLARIALSERVPDESTVRKLTRRIGEQTVNDMTREWSLGFASGAWWGGRCGSTRR
jgi:hypothetical protein